MKWFTCWSLSAGIEKLPLIELLYNELKTRNTNLNDNTFTSFTYLIYPAFTVKYSKEM